MTSAPASTVQPSASPARTALSTITAKPLFVPLLDNGNGSVMASFMMDHGAAFAGREIFMIRASDSHANRGMNKIANAFLESGCDIWINIDADIRFRKIDIDNLLSHFSRQDSQDLLDSSGSRENRENPVSFPLSLVYGIYPKKEDSAPPCLCTFNVVPEADPKTGLARVRRCGRGFMAVHRRLLEAMKEDNGGPALRYHNHTDAGGAVKIEWDFFPSGVVTGEFSALESTQPLNLSTAQPTRDEDGYPIREWISEDWYFCEVSRKLGFPTLVDTRIALGHVGQKEYRFGAEQVTRMDSNITSWREIHGWFDYEDLYRELALKVPESGIFVEVGVWLGRSIAAFAEFAAKVDKTILLHAVDTFKGAPANQAQNAMLQAHGGSTEKSFIANMIALGLEPVKAHPGAACWPYSGLKQPIFVHACPSVEVAEDFSAASIDAAFIDGDHRYEAVAADITAWLPKIKIGGVLCGHDIDEPGVLRAVKEAFDTDFDVVGRCWRVNKK